MTMPRFLAAVAALAALALAAVASAPHIARSQQVGAVQPGTAAIWTDRQQYTLGQSVQVCYTIPVAGQITIANIPPGNTPVFYSGPSAGTSGCQTGVATPPVGQNCLRLTYPLLGGSGQTQTCFQIAGPNPPPPPAGISIRTDHSSYRIGDPIRVCYSVPAPGPITITDILPGGAQQTFFSGFDDGTGGCIPGTITPPAGTECMRITFTYQADGGQVSAQTCFQVIGTPPPPPGGWTEVGSAQVDGAGNYNFDTQLNVDQSLTYMRVTSGSCGDNPASTLVWESNLQRDRSGPLGVNVWDGDLAPTGLAVSSGGSGHARLSRPVTLNPVTQVDATLFGVGIIYTGTTLTVCLRAP